MSPLLATAITVTLVLYAAAMALALVRLMRGPSAQDRVLALDFLSVVAMLMMLVLAVRYDSSMYFEAALLLALFSFVSSVALAKFLLRGEVIELATPSSPACWCSAAASSSPPRSDSGVCRISSPACMRPRSPRPSAPGW